MTHTYNINGMTCTGCQAKVKSRLLMMPDVTSAEVDLEKGQATIQMSRHIPLAELQQGISPENKYVITEDKHDHSFATMQADGAKTWLATYKPLLLVFAFITGVSLITAQGNWMAFMNYFMAGFFIVFSFFKLLDLQAFADSYAMYDLLAIKFKPYGFIYPFIELALGIAYLTSFYPVFTNAATIVVMGFSSLGVIRSVVKKQQIQCACLGAVFNLPMSTVTIVEDLLMVVMAGVMLMAL